jgi:hypothetical protein
LSLRLCHHAGEVEKRESRSSFATTSAFASPASSVSNAAGSISRGH